MGLSRDILRFALVTCAMCQASLARADSPEEHFEKHIRPLFLAKCVDCHSGNTADGDLDLNTRAGFLKGGMSGDVVDENDPNLSLLFERVVTTDEDAVMPPEDRLNPNEVAAIRSWIESGSPWPETAELASATSAAETHWAFQPVTKPQVPELAQADWCWNSIDAFAFQKMQQAELVPVGDADAGVWLRRLHLDLTGLPPTPLQQSQLAHAAGEQSSAQRGKALRDFELAEIERLLNSHEYAERQARSWLDLARYADTSGDGTDTPIPEARYYRDWVIDAFEQDMPYDQFVIEQIAGDLLAAQNPEAEDAFRKTIATGFIALSRRFGNSKFADMHQIIDDTLDTIGKSTMGLSLGCARCHHHKFDPITLEDYYGLYGYFSSTQYPHAGTEHQKDRSDLPAIQVPASNADQYESSVAWAVSDKAQPQDAKIHLAGDPARKGDLAPRGFLAFLGDDNLEIPAGSSGRLQLAQRLASPDNPLFARVMVNRIWKSHFGRGLVANVSNFGRQTPQPAHHQLLDFLACEFVESGWSVKHIHRLILTSHLYRLSSQTSPHALAKDEANQWLWHFPRVRMDAETLRDSMLFVSGELEPGDGGRHPFKPTEQLKYTQGRPFEEIFDHNRRSIYLMTPRLNKHPMLAMFDGADANVTTAKRGESTVPLQALFFMNGDFVARQADALARRIIEQTQDSKGRASYLWSLALARPPTDVELQTARSYLDSYTDELLAEGQSQAVATRTAWASVARSLLASNEFIYID